MKSSKLDLLLAARRIANYAEERGVLAPQEYRRSTCEHLGAALADSVLQAGLNYRTVVKPRVSRILREYPNFDTVSSLISLIQERATSDFLNWHHHEKIGRFEVLVEFLDSADIDNTHDLSAALATEDFCVSLKSISGIGPKTVDYMACLVGIDSIAVDRHVRSVAREVGLQNDDYYFLRESFCCAADLLSVSRREFDAWLWRRGVANGQMQMALDL